jgi:hypothetical protein
MYLSNQSLLVIIVVGIIAGWLADKVVQGEMAIRSAAQLRQSSN